MGSGFLGRTWNVGNLLVVIGLLALVVSLLVPYLTARRVARIETRAQLLASLLLEVGRSQPALDFTDRAQGEGIALALRAKAREKGVPPSSRPKTFAPGRQDGFYYRARHYCYLLTATPVPARATAQKVAPAIEVYAWPRAALSAGREVFFFPGDRGGERGGRAVRAARSRNLLARYQGLGHPPRPGCARPRPTNHPPRDWYRGQDDERWFELQDGS